MDLSQNPQSSTPRCLTLGKHLLPSDLSFFNYKLEITVLLRRMVTSTKILCLLNGWCGVWDLMLDKGKFLFH